MASPETEAAAGWSPPWRTAEEEEEEERDSPSNSSSRVDSRRRRFADEVVVVEDAEDAGGSLRRVSRCAPARSSADFTFSSVHTLWYSAAGTAAGAAGAAAGAAAGDRSVRSRLGACSSSSSSSPPGAALPAGLFWSSAAVRPLCCHTIPTLSSQTDPYSPPATAFLTHK